MALAALALIAPAGAAHASSCPGADTDVSAETLTSAKAAVFCIVNAERAARGLPALTENDQLALAAQRHSDDMVARSFFDHFAPPPAPFGVDPGARITAAGYVWQAYGENIAVGQVTPREVMTGWMKSHGHCRNILSPDVTQLGVGVAAAAATLPGQDGGTWTQDFGNPQGTVAPPASSDPQRSCDPAGTALEGLDEARQPDGTSDTSPSGTTSSAPPSSSTPQDPQTIDITTTPTAPATLNLTLRHAGATLTVSGTLHPANGKRHRVSVLVRRGKRAVRHTHTRTDTKGRFRLRFSPLQGAGRLTVRVSVGSLHVTRTIGR